MSLREQLLKAGLVSEDQVKKVESEAKKKTHEGKKNKALGAQQAAKKAEKKRQQQAAQAQKRKQDKQLNQQRDAVKRRRENAVRIRQLIASNRLNDAEAELRYNFQSGKNVRSLRVTEQQKQQLAMGWLGIVRNPQDEFDFPLVDRETAEKLAAIDPKLVVVLYDKVDRLDDDDDWGDWESGSE